MGSAPLNNSRLASGLVSYLPDVRVWVFFPKRVHLDHASISHFSFVPYHHEAFSRSGAASRHKLGCL